MAYVNIYDRPARVILPCVKLINFTHDWKINDAN